MRIIIFLLLTISIFGQVSIDSAKVTCNNNVYTLEGYATFIGTPSADDYKIGFLYGPDYSDIYYIPMGSYEWNAGTKQLKIMTEITNPTFGAKYYFTPYIQPKAAVAKFHADGQNGIKPDIICDPVIIAQGHDGLNKLVGEQIEFFVEIEEKEGCSVNYQWQYKLEGGEWQATGQNSSTYTTPALQLNFNNAKVRCRVYNDAGESYSGTATIKVTQ